MWLRSDSAPDDEGDEESDEESDEDELDAGDRPGDMAIALSPQVDATLLRRGPDLAVSFAPRDRADPMAEIAARLGWSHLGLNADRTADLRADAVTGFFNSLVDGTTLDAFDNVLFVGAGEYADPAMGYAICAPCARLVVFDPPANLTRGGRYPVAPDHLATASAGFVIFGPGNAAAARALTGGSMTALPLRLGPGPRLDVLSRLGALDEVLAEAMAATLDPLGFYRLLRARRDHDPYLRGIAARARAGGKPARAAIVLASAATRLGRNRYLREARAIEYERSSR